MTIVGIALVVFYQSVDNADAAFILILEYTEHKRQKLTS